MADRISSKNISLFEEMAADPVDLIEITGVIVRVLRGSI